jgi:hypothetical protein
MFIRPSPPAPPPAQPLPPLVPVVKQEPSPHPVPAVTAPRPMPAVTAPRPMPAAAPRPMPAVTAARPVPTAAAAAGSRQLLPPVLPPWPVFSGILQGFDALYSGDTSAEESAGEDVHSDSDDSDAPLNAKDAADAEEATGGSTGTVSKAPYLSTSMFKGVSWSSTTQSWSVSCRMIGKQSADSSAWPKLMCERDAALTVDLARESRGMMLPCTDRNIADMCAIKHDHLAVQCRVGLREGVPTPFVLFGWCAGCDGSVCAPRAEAALQQLESVFRKLGSSADAAIVCMSSDEEDAAVRSPPPIARAASEEASSLNNEARIASIHLQATFTLARSRYGRLPVGVLPSMKTHKLYWCDHCGVKWSKSSLMTTGTAWFTGLDDAGIQILLCTTCGDYYSRLYTRRKVPFAPSDKVLAAMRALLSQSEDASDAAARPVYDFASALTAVKFSAEPLSHGRVAVERAGLLGKDIDARLL